MAFDPEHDDPSLLRTVVMLLRAAAIAASARTGATEIATAEEKIGEAIDSWQDRRHQEVAGLIIKNAEKIDSQSEPSTPPSADCLTRHSPRLVPSTTMLRAKRARTISVRCPRPSDSHRA